MAYIKEYIRYGTKNEDGTVDWGDWAENSGGGGLSGTVGSATQPVWLNSGELAVCNEMVTLSSAQSNMAASLAFGDVASALDFAKGIQDNSYGATINGSFVRFRDTTGWTGFSSNTWLGGFAIGQNRYDNTSGYTTGLKGMLWEQGGLQPKLFVITGNTTDNNLAYSYVEALTSSNYTSHVTKIGTSTVGSSTNPVYLDSGTPKACSTSVANVTYSHSTESAGSSAGKGYIKIGPNVMICYGGDGDGVDCTFAATFYNNPFVLCTDATNDSGNMSKNRQRIDSISTSKFSITNTGDYTRYIAIGRYA